MRTSLRVGMLIGGAGSIALSVLQLRIGLSVAPCLIIAGIISGLAVAKWLDRPSYGRQLEEGARAGLLACGLPGFVALLSLLVAGPRDVASLEATSHFFSFDFSPLIQQLSVLGWAGIDALALIASAITGIVWSAVLVQVFAWSKTGRAAQVVQQARLTAVAVQRSDANNLPPLLAAAPTARAEQASPVAAGVPVAAKVAALPPAPAPLVARRGGPVASGTQQPTVIRMSSPMLQGAATSTAAQAPSPPRVVQPPTARQYMPTPEPEPTPQPPVSGPVRSTRSPRGKTSAARRMESRLNQQMRQALEAWAAQEDGVEITENQDDEPSTSSSKRSPKPSTFLNSERGSERPAKRNRKKNQTRDWLC